MNNNSLQQIIKMIEDKKIDVLIVKDVSQMSTYADAFIVAIAESERQMNGLIAAFKELKDPDIHIEGKNGDGWIIILKDGIAAHIFTWDEHETYRLDKLYADQPTISL